MTGSVNSYTPHFKFKKINFNTGPWHDLEWSNWAAVDALMYTYINISNVQGVWQNSTAYTVGQRVIDDATGQLFECLVDHTSAATGTFADDRTAHTTYWQSLGILPRFRGAWQTGTLYSANDYVVNGHQFAVCYLDHTAGVFADDITAGKWIVIADLTASVAAAAASALAASNSETAAAASELNAAASEAIAVAAKDAANLDAAATAADRAAVAADTAIVAADKATVAGYKTSVEATAAAVAADAAAADASATAAGISETNAALSASSAADSAAAAAGAMRFQNTWDASTNTPVIPAASTANKGNYYIVSVDGTTTIDGISDWKANDWIVSIGTVWKKIDNTEPTASESVAGIARIGTQTEVDTGSDDSRFVTPLKLATWVGNKLLAVARTITKAWGYSFQTVAYNANITWNVSAYPAATITLTGNPNITATNIEEGKVYQLRLVQDATGSRVPVMNASVFKYGDDGAPTYSTAASKTDYSTFVGKGTTELHHMGTKTGF